MNKEDMSGNIKVTKIKFTDGYIFDNRNVDETLPGAELSDLEYLFDKYIESVKRGKPSQRMANHLKIYIDAVQVQSKI